VKSDIPAEDIEEFEEHQLERYAQLKLEPFNYGGDEYQALHLTSDVESFLRARDGNPVIPPPGSRFDHPAYRRKIARMGAEFMAACSVKVETPIIGLWPGKVPGGLHGELPLSGRSLILFTEGAFSFFARLFSIFAKSYPCDFDGFDSEDERVHQVELWCALLTDADFTAFNRTILDLIIRDDAHELRHQLALSTKSGPQLSVELTFPKELGLKEMDQAHCRKVLDDQCFRFLVGHEFGHILVSRGQLEYVDHIPPLFGPQNPSVRVAYNTEITCDCVGVEYAIKYAQSQGVLPEFGYAGVHLFFQIWHLVCESVWRVQFGPENMPNAADLVYLEHPPTLIRAHYALDIMRGIYSEKEAVRAMKYASGLNGLLSAFRERLVPALDELLAQGLGYQIEPEIANSLNPAFSDLYARNR